MDLWKLLLLKLVCCGGPLLLVLVPSSVFLAAVAAFADWGWSLAAVALAGGAVLWRVKRRTSCRVVERHAASLPGVEPSRSGGA